MSRILVVDDEEYVRDLLVEFLQKRGYEAEGAESGAQALILARERPPQAILLDISMPGMNGITTLEKLREEHPDSSVIMISGVADHQTALKALQLGAFDYIQKPFDLYYLERVLVTKLAGLS
ncbi:MAG TPA: response regulator [Candidatus Saccharimonadales bacterium]|nr:response regulator [Candidatus Saccharimonadales bacterium]